jgi:cold shock protein
MFILVDGLVAGYVAERGENQVAQEREVGLCKWFDPKKGFGFISREGAKDVFVHHTAIDMEGYRTLEEGDEVEFSVEQGAKGLQAVNVTKLHK